MGILEKIAPGYALRREVARRRLKRLRDYKGGQDQRSFDVVTGGRKAFDILQPHNSPNSAIDSSIEGLRNQVRQLEYNNGFVAGPVRRIVNNVVGNGFHFQARVRPDRKFAEIPKINDQMADRFNHFAEKRWKKWEKEADKRLLRSFSRICRTIEGSLIRDGEVLCIIRDSSRPSRMIPQCLEVLEADRLQTPISEINNPDIRNGIVYDREGVPETYLVLKRHPGDSIPTPGKNLNDFEEVPAWNDNGTKKVLHLFNPVRPEQSRGFSAWASALEYIHNLDRYHEAEIFAALEDACLTGFVKTPAPSAWQANYTAGDISADEASNSNRIHNFAPNKWHYLNPGEDVYIHSPSRPNQAFGELTNQLLRGPANSLDIPPEVFSQDWHGMNYSNARTVLLAFYLSCRIRQQYLIEAFCVPVYEVVLRSFVARGLVPGIGFDRRTDDFLAHAWIPPGWDWVDPVKESKGKEIELANDMTTLSNIHSARGLDFDETIEARAKELRKIKDLEDEYDIEFPKTSKRTTPTTTAGESRSVRAI